MTHKPRSQLDLFGPLGESLADRRPSGRPSVGAPFSNLSTSLEAAKAIAPLVGSDEAMILNLIRGRNGLTCDEIEVIAGLLHQTCAARINGLMKRGAIKDSGEKRLTRSLRRAIVWRATENLTTTE